MRAQHDATRAVLTVGGGRGFVVEVLRRNPWFQVPERVIITAAHCLPHLPPSHGASSYWERTYANLIGPLGKKPTIWVECYFADPVADLAVLGMPDNQQLPDEADAYEELVEAAVPLRFADIVPGHPARLLALNGRWFPCDVSSPAGGALWLANAAEDIVGGMSGSPIVQGGSAVGLVSVSSAMLGEPHRQGGPNPRLLHDLPARMLRRRKSPRKKTAKKRTRKKTM